MTTPTTIPYTRVTGYLDFITKTPIPQADIAFFSKKPCVHAYLHPSPSTPRNKTYRPIPFISRYRKDDTSDRFFSRIASTPETIPHALAFMRMHELEDWKVRADEALDATREKSARTHPTEPDLVVFMQLGADMTGFRDTLHGGVLSALLDEALGTCIEGFKHALLGREGERVRLYTGNLNVTFRRPVEVPGLVVAKVWLVKREGRKWVLDGVMEGEDGKVRAEVKGLWILEKRGANL